MRAAIVDLLQAADYSHEYLGVNGHPGFLSGARSVAFGKQVKHDNIASLQTVGGTGACHMGAAFLKRWYSYPSNTSPVAYVSDPSWENHQDIFRHEGIDSVLYPYWDSERKTADFDSMRECLDTAPSGSIIVLHACGHNPTGMDLTHSQWVNIGKLLKAKNHFAFFDSAYQGFVSGDLQRDNRWEELTVTSINNGILIS